MFISRRDKKRALELVNSFGWRLEQLEKDKYAYVGQLAKQQRMIDELAAALGAKFIAIPAHDQLVPEQKVAALQPVP